MTALLSGSEIYNFTFQHLEKGFVMSLNSFGVDLVRGETPGGFYYLTILSSEGHKAIIFY